MIRDWAPTSDRSLPGTLVLLIIQIDAQLQSERQQLRVCQRLLRCRAGRPAPRRQLLTWRRSAPRAGKGVRGQLEVTAPQDRVGCCCSLSPAPSGGCFTCFNHAVTHHIRLVNVRSKPLLRAIPARPRPPGTDIDAGLGGIDAGLGAIDAAETTAAGAAQGQLFHMHVPLINERLPGSGEEGAPCASLTGARCWVQGCWRGPGSQRVRVCRCRCPQGQACCQSPAERERAGQGRATQLAGLRSRAVQAGWDGQRQAGWAVSAPASSARAHSQRLASRPARR